MSDPLDDTSIYTPVQEFDDVFFASAASALRFDFGAASHVGNVRSHNEDHYAVLRLVRGIDRLLSSLPPDSSSIADAYSYAMIVADGMGGLKSGELASRLALQTMVELAGQASSWVMKFTDVESQQIESRVQAYVRRIQATLVEKGQANPAAEGMGTTWTSAHLLAEHAVIVHLGDSRAYLFRDGVLHQITRDQTMAQALIDSGVEPASVSRFRHILLNNFGGGNEKAAATIYDLAYQAGDQLLLCTDGLSDMVSDRDIADELRRYREPQATCDALVEKALENGGKDNVTVVLVSIRDAESLLSNPTAA